MVDEPTRAVECSECFAGTRFEDPDDEDGWTPEVWASCCSAEEIELARVRNQRRRGRQRKMAVAGVGLLLVAAVSTVSAAVVGAGGHRLRPRTSIAVFYEARCPVHLGAPTAPSSGDSIPLSPDGILAVPVAGHQRHCDA